MRGFGVGRPRGGRAPRAVRRVPLLPARQRVDVPRVQGVQPRSRRLRRVRARARRQRAPRHLPDARAPHRRGGVVRGAAGLLPARGGAGARGAGRHRGGRRPRLHRLPLRAAAPARRGRRGRRRPGRRARGLARPPLGADVAGDPAEAAAQAARAPSEGRGADHVLLTGGAAATSCRGRPDAVRDGGAIHYFAGGPGDALPLALGDALPPRADADDDLLVVARDAGARLLAARRRQGGGRRPGQPSRCHWSAWPRAWS